MDPRCIAAVRAAAGGRRISDGKIRAIEEQLDATMRELARRDKAGWASMSYEQRVAEAARVALEDIQAQAALKEFRAQQQMVATAETGTRIADQARLGRVSRMRGLAREIVTTQMHIDGIKVESSGMMRDTVRAAENRDGTGVLRNLGMRIFDLDNPAMTFDIVREVFRNADGHTGNKAAQAGARAWLDTIETLRLRFNAAGGDVGKLAYGYIAQMHDRVKIARVTPEEFATDVMPLLDRRQYLNADGSLMTDAQVRELVEASHETLATGGDNKTEPGAFKGAGSRANRGSDSRVLHFKDGDAWIAYMAKYGEGSLYDAMLGHVGRMARDIGLVERYGPNPEAQFRLQYDLARRAEANPEKVSASAVAKMAEGFWGQVSGKVGTPVNAALARRFQNARALMTAAKLGGAVLSSITDVGTIASTLHYNRIPYFAMLGELGKQIGSREHREFLKSHGIMAEMMSNQLNRVTGEHVGSNLFGMASNSAMKLSFMNAWTDGLRASFSSVLMRNFADKLGTEWGKLSEWDRYRMERKGITERDWDIITRAQASEDGGTRYLTAEAIRSVDAPDAQAAASRWAGFVQDESHFAVTNPDMLTKHIMTFEGLQAGTAAGEIVRTAAQFKSFPVAMLTRHWGRVFDTPQGLEGAPLGYRATTDAGAAASRIALLAALTVTSTMLGAIVLQTKSLVSGKDPMDMTQARFWARAVAQGGAWGYLGDLVLKDPAESRPNSMGQTVGSMLGPAAGSAAGLVWDVGIANAWKAAEGKDAHLAADALGWLNSNVPYASLWWARPMWEHAVLHNLQEAANPGYLQRMRRRAMKDYGQDFWWAPGDPTPDRAPDLARAVGQ